VGEAAGGVCVSVGVSGGGCCMLSSSIGGCLGVSGLLLLLRTTLDGGRGSALSIVGPCSGGSGN